MKVKFSIGTVGFALLGILGIAVLFIALGSREAISYPSATSYRPSGTSAFHELIRKLGLRTRIEFSETLSLGADDVVIAFQMVPTYENPFEDEETLHGEVKPVPRFVQSVEAHLDRGGTVIVLPIHRSFQVHSDVLMHAKSAVRDSKRENQIVSWNGQDVSEPGAFGTPKATIDLWATPSGEPFARLSRVRKGELIEVADGMIATNRFIDRHQNAEVVADLVRRFTVDGSQVVFAEASFGNVSEKSLVATIGPWAQAAYWQLVFLFGVLVYALGRPFGLPEVNRRVQTGARDLLEAIAGSYRRGRMTHVALASTLAEADRMLKRWYRGVLEHLGSDPESVAIARLKLAMARAQAALEMKPTDSEALDLVAGLERAIQEVADAGGHRYRSGE